MKLDSEDLNDLLAEANEIINDKARTKLRIVTLNTDLSKERLKEIFGQRFQVSEQGDFLELFTTYSKYEVEKEVFLYYYHSPESGKGFLYTLSTSEGISRTLEPVIKGNEGIYYLWMPPVVVEEVKEDVLEIEGSKLTFFSYDTFGRTTSDEQRRPGVERSGEYEGDDAAQTLEEMKLEYGIKPTKLEFKVPTEGDFSFNHTGEFTIAGGNVNYFHRRVVEESVQRTERLNQEVKSSKLEVTQEEGVDKLEKKELEIQLQQELDYEDRDELLEKMENFDFIAFDYKAEEGSLLFNGKITDSKNGGMMSLSTDGSKLLVLPKYDSKFDSIMRFYRFIVEKIDPNAKIEYSDNESGRGLNTPTN